MPDQRKHILLLLLWVTIAVVLTAILFGARDESEQAHYADLQLRYKSQLLLNRLSTAKIKIAPGTLSQQLPALKKHIQCDILFWQPGQQPQSTLSPLVQNQLSLLLIDKHHPQPEFDLSLPDAGYRIRFVQVANSKYYAGAAMRKQDIHQIRSFRWQHLIVLLIVLLLLAGLSAYYSGRPLFRILEQLKETLRRADKGYLQTISASKAKGESADLVYRFNQYAKQLNGILDTRYKREHELHQQLKESRNNLIKLTENLERVVERRTKEIREKDLQLLQTGKLAGLGQLSTGIAHEINQPLNVIKLTVTGMMRQYSLKKELSTEMVVRELNTINQQTIRVQKIIHHMKAFARKRPNVHFETLDLNKPLHDALLMVGQQLKGHNVQLELQLAEDLAEISGDAIQIEQIFINLLNNARDAVETKESLLKEKGRGDFQKKITVRSWNASPHVYLQIEDNGSGMTETVRSQIFEPFFSTKQQKGTGLGMSITFNLVKNMNGEIDVESELAKGTTFTIRFPAI